MRWFNSWAAQGAVALHLLFADLQLAGGDRTYIVLREGCCRILQLSCMIGMLELLLGERTPAPQLKSARQKHRTMVEVPQKLASVIIDVHDEQGREWLAQFPELIDTIKQHWNIQVNQPLDSSTYHFVAPAILEDGTEAILKLGVPGSHFIHEVECLKRYQGLGAVQLFKHDTAKGAMLLELVRPGSNLVRVDEQKAIEAVVSVMSKLHRAPIKGADLPTINDWGLGFRRLRDMFDGMTGPLPREIVDEAESLFSELATSMDEPALLHGDLHHENILASIRDEWVAIDPQGVLGEPCYEIGAFLRNPVPEIVALSDLKVVIKRREALFSEITGFDSARIYGWGFSQAVLSAIWSIEDHSAGWEGALHIAKSIRVASA